ncbi:BCCT family transporter [Marinobacter sp. ELB17]|uniref:BCCT family transporter n=1 Tax=Marinobacter sp. ELB17 TaxID=270374 RepID=UPI0000F39BBB|nr:BCCT family transporter [Marinobacter sp. ELB17]EAZ99741.1 choline/carnitine/betaine transport family protein [Marinobacter sp. ELB17]
MFWATLEGVIAAALLTIGGADALTALQAGSVTTGLPFTIVLLVMCVGLAKGLRHEQKLLAIKRKRAPNVFAREAKKRAAVPAAG